MVSQEYLNRHFQPTEIHTTIGAFVRMARMVRLFDIRKRPVVLTANIWTSPRNHDFDSRQTDLA